LYSKVVYICCYRLVVAHLCIGHSNLENDVRA